MDRFRCVSRRRKLLIRKKILLVLLHCQLKELEVLRTRTDPVHPIFTLQENEGGLNRFVKDNDMQELRTSDFSTAFRMTPAKVFDKLPSKVENKITKQITSMRKPISAEERLCVTPIPRQFLTRSHPPTSEGYFDLLAWRWTKSSNDTSSNIKLEADSVPEQLDLNNCDIRQHEINAEDPSNFPKEECPNSFKPLNPEASTTPPSHQGSSRTNSPAALTTSKSWPKRSYKRKRVEMQDTTEMLKKVSKDTSYDEENDQVSMFFASMSRQVSAAKLTPTKFLDLQIGVLNVLKKVTETQNDD